jgi:hypothetical protein
VPFRVFPARLANERLVALRQSQLAITFHLNFPSTVTACPKWIDLLAREDFLQITVLRIAQYTIQAFSF